MRASGQENGVGFEVGAGWELRGEGGQPVLFVQKQCTGKNSGRMDEILVEAAAGLDPAAQTVQAGLTALPLLRK
jgi:hypothetical protein